MTLIRHQMKTHLLFIGALLLIVTASTAAFSHENQIVRENRKEGTTNWLLFNYDQVIAPGRDDLWKREKGIEGYCSHTSILPNGIIVFDAGTCWWNMVLSSPPGFMNPPRRDFSKDDPRVQRITANVLKRMIQGKP